MAGQDDATTEDTVLGGRVRLLQPARGYRAGLDAALLAAACDARPGERVLEAGCGVGGALLAAAMRRPGAGFVGVERDAEAAALCARNGAANGLADRVTVLMGEVEQPFRRLGLERFDAVIANPPFFDDPTALRAPAPAKRGAWLADAGLSTWITFLLAAARDGGTITVVHRADRLADLFSALGAKAGSFVVRPVHPFADQPAKRVLVRAVRGGRAPLRLMPPLVLHEREGGKHAAQLEAILRGEAALPWS
jgi:tRNA1(Val) A37 N6-methylase TrmN6